MFLKAYAERTKKSDATATNALGTMTAGGL
jgi:hypothetical protein